MVKFGFEIEIEIGNAYAQHIGKEDKSRCNRLLRNDTLKVLF